MGIRVHKMIGYGINNLVEDDPRVEINILQNFCNEELNGKDFLKFIKSEKEEIIEAILSEEGSQEQAELAYKFLVGWKEEKGFKKYENYKSVGYDDEFGLGNVLLLTPPSMAGNWSRYNDSIDWSEETQNHNQAARYQLLNHPLYPFDFKYALLRGAKKFSVEEIKQNSSLVGRRSLEQYDARVLTSDIMNLMSYGENTPFKQEFMASYRPALPAELVAFMLWSRAFTDLDAMKDSLRPMLYVYWS